MDDLFSLDGRIAVLTGASSGLGDRFARVLHAAGATVVLGARRIDRLEALAAELGDRVVPVACDVAVDADCERLIEAAGPRIDVLVNNAGIGSTYPAEDEPLEHWRQVVDVNLTGLFVLCQLAGRKMLEQRSGSIVNIAEPLVKIDAGNQWVTVEIRAVGPKMTARLNGMLTAEATDAKYARGPIALQAAGGLVRDRNVQIREIK